MRVRLASLLCCVLVALAACGGGSPPLSDRLILERDAGLALLDLASGREELLLRNPQEVFLLDPAVSPDGRRLAYASRLAPFVGPEEEADLGADLYVANIDGSGPRLLLEHSAPDEELRSPAWLPDGRSLLFVRQRVEVRRGQPFTVRSIERLDLNTGRTTVVIESGFQPSVCSDGRRIVYVNDDFLVMTLRIANIDGSNQRQIASAEEGFSWFNSPQFSPNCDRIAFGGAELPEQQTFHGPAERFVAARAGRGGATPRRAAYNGLPEDIWIMDVAAGTFENVADLDLDLPNLTWSGDGERLFALAGAALFFIDPEGGHREIGEGTFHGHIDWIDDGAAAATP